MAIASMGQTRKERMGPLPKCPSPREWSRKIHRRRTAIRGWKRIAAGEKAHIVVTGFLN
jgi:hypothetical protein